MKIFVLAEKPDQAEKYAHTFGKPRNDKGVWKVYSDILNADVLIASAVGHLVEKDNPYKNYENWELENLPALPEKFSYKVKKGVSYSFNNIKKCIKECDCIIIATDPDREGESIAYKILNEIPGSINKVKYRLWANSLTKKGIESAFKKLRDPSETINYYHEADARDDADWLVGFNLSPFVTIKMKEVVEHYAIIPTENIPNIEELDSYEKIIYQMVTFQTLLMFAEDYNYQSTTITIKNDASSVEFKVSGNVTINKGWRKYKQTKSEDKELPSLKVMDSLILKANVKQDQTKPPARITEEYLLKKLLPKYNLGTSATRDGILDLIQEREYVKKEKKTGQFTPTIRGIKLIHFLDKLDIIYTNPETTQKWELLLAQIGQGKIRKSDFVEKVKWAISKQIEKGKQLL